MPKSFPEMVIGLLGFGIVGSQVYHALTKNAGTLFDRTGINFRIKKILVRNPKKTRPFQPPAHLLTTKASDILHDPEIHLIIEVLGGLEPAQSYIAQALQSGKGVVTANKGVMATHGHKLLALAAKHKADLFFEASVAGAIPILRPLQETLATDKIFEVAGIVNGTTNFILSQMSHDHSTFEQALFQAQRLGYAEPDPTFDITGMDAAYKLVILASLAFGYLPKIKDTLCEGITKISPSDIQQAKELGYRIKLLAKAILDEEGLGLCVSPTLIPSHHPLYNVEGPYNAILIRGERLGDLMFYGQGAGGIPTSTAVVGDIVQAAKNYKMGTCGKSLPHLQEKIKLKSSARLLSRFYFRLTVEDKPGTLAALAQNFAKEKVSFSAVLQKENTTNITDILFLTHDVREGAFRKALQKSKTFPFVQKIQSVLRVES